ncbi:DNA polymerase III subunit delta' [Marinomonas aquimarina]|uniref:DNA-directed DNA polymerase n=1 Tax=Marinomonas aquimarina TaxID=295068 RepID=A0A1A8TSW6_9GAMM|nr:DNA polymerase III subunit delta' [Marinomonas aquimarina]SBS36413.1 DNA polymerase III subunit delta' [Marinomonas aquimarina]
MSGLAPWLEHTYQQAQQWRLQGTFHHALLISGSNGVGQNAFAEAMAKLLLCEKTNNAPCGQCHSCQVAKADTHPDLLVLDGQEGGIRVDAVRQVVAKVANKPQLGYSKVVLLHEAHQMNVNAANAILKALEEPPSSTFFILTSHTSRALMPTILSRCQRMTLPTPSPEQVNQWLLNEAKVDASKLLWFSQTPYHLLALTQSPSFDMLQQLPAWLADWLNGNLRTDELAGKANKDATADFIDGLLALLTQAVQYTVTGQCHEQILAAVTGLLARYDIYRLMTFIQQLTELKAQLDKTHLNPTIQIIGELNSW